MPSAKELAATLGSAACGILRYSHLIPMVVIWGLVILAILMILFVGNQKQGVLTLVWIHEQTSRIPGLNEWISNYFNSINSSTASGGVRISNDELIPLFKNLWLALSALLWVLSLLWHWLRGTQASPLWPLRRKLFLAAGASIVAVFLVCVGLANTDARADMSTLDVALYLGVSAFVLWLVSAYSLTAAHLIGVLQQRLESLGEQPVAA